MRDFALQQRDLCLGDIRRIGINIGSRPICIGTCTNNNRVLPCFFDLNDSNTGIDPINHADTVGIEPKLLHLFDSQFAKSIVTDRTDKANVAAKLCYSYRLIGALAAKANAIARRIECLAGTR
ncbi:hypothetical protein D3C80_1680390 [compost metagenome]